MSFYSVANNNNPDSPGLVSAQGFPGIRERVCVQVKKVYDACLQQLILEDKLVFVKPEGGPFARPLRFVKCRNTAARVKIKNLRIDRLPDRENFARVRGNVEIPIQVEFVDADGMTGFGTAVVVVPKDVVLFVPDESIIPFEAEAIVGATCADGAFVEDWKFRLDICITIILKIIAEVELLIPAFGFCRIPPCEEFAANICAEFFGLPLFPPQLEDLRNNG